MVKKADVTALPGIQLVEYNEIRRCKHRITRIQRDIDSLSNNNVEKSWKYRLVDLNWVLSALEAEKDKCGDKLRYLKEKRREEQQKNRQEEGHPTANKVQGLHDKLHT